MPHTPWALWRNAPLPSIAYLLLYGRMPKTFAFPSTKCARETVEHGFRTVRGRSTGKEKRRLVKSVFLEIAQAYHCPLEEEKKRG